MGEEQLLAVGVDEALAVYAEPKQRGRVAYVTDGETNATLREGDKVETIEPEWRTSEEADDREALTAQSGRVRSTRISRSASAADDLSTVAMGKIVEALTLPLELA